MKHDEFWKQFPPIPGFDCVKMKHDIQAKIYERTKHMSWDERIEYLKRAGRAFRESGKIPTREPDAAVGREEPPKPGGQQ